ncbi:RDD family protein [Mycoplasma phocoenae]|uniref:RDD family protein n=1 Tax=Mycoplasma phocoenae TaxID=754517 RepID=A0A858U0X2_9MOLU|nr:RDD family protein [Mycoplasma phocoenae]QJG66734.1 RDD family protein [Mycoplasma phocoenae]
MTNSIKQKVNKKANFWIRLLATTIDLILFLSLITIYSLLLFDKGKGQFKTEFFYYLWLFLIIVSMASIYIFIPMIFKGKTLGLWICRLKIISNKANTKIFKTIIQRQLLNSILWIIGITLMLILISHETFIQMAKTTKNSTEKLSVIQQAFMSVPVTICSLAGIIDVFLMLTTARTSKIGWNDTFSNSSVVFINKYEDVFHDDLDFDSIKPKKRELPQINFKN